ncbi:MAG: hypothetical protein KGK14_06085 [Bacteroidota bacterium]|jgi:hypothetical protein|nr:hypothetical protein [Bacteroidota bacterium]
MDTIHLPAASASILQQTVYQYRLAVVLPDYINQMLLQQQAFFTAQYGYICRAPRLTMACFKADEALEDTLLRYLHRIAGMQQSLSLSLNNYSGLPEHSIYVRLQERVAFRQWVQALQPVGDYIVGNGFPAMQKVVHPYLPIADGLPPQVYHKAMAHYSQQLFYAAFRATEWILIKEQPALPYSRSLCKFYLV